VRVLLFVETTGKSSGKNCRGFAGQVDALTNSVKNSVKPGAPAGTRAGCNGGKLRSGNPGNKGGGRRPDLIRSVVRGSLETALGLLESRLRDPELGTAELVKIVELLLRYGIGPALPECFSERPIMPMKESIDEFLLGTIGFVPGQTGPK